MDCAGSNAMQAFIKRNIALDGNIPPSVPLVVAKSQELSENDQLGLEIVPESLELLRSIEKPIAPVAICGPYRTGKSYFLSRMVGDTECFKVTHSTEACTRGIWMATAVLECPEFVVVFFDTEGIGAVDDSTQGSINFMISTALISSLLIYNTKRPLQMKDIEKLRWCIAMSKHFQRKGSQYQPKMPKFLWLLRDMDLSTGSGSPTEWLLRKLQVPRCKDIFEALTSSFSSIECTFLPPPALEKEVLHDIIQRKHQLTPHFNEELMKTENKILSIVEPKRCECGPFTGFSLASLIEECVAQVNHQSDVPALDTTWKVATELQLQQFTTKLVDEYEEEMKFAVNDLLPIEEFSLSKIHNQIVKRKCCLLENKLAILVPVVDIRHVFSEKARHEFLGRIVERDPNGQINGGRLAPFLHQNFRLSKELCTKTYDRFYDRFVASKLQLAFAEGIPHDITQDVALFEEQYRRVACGPAKDEVFIKSRVKSLEEEQKLKQIPGHIENLEVIGIAKDRIKLYWEKPVVNPEAAHTYEIYTIEKDASLRLIETTDECYALITNLKSNKQYTFVVRAKNELFLGHHVSLVSVKTTLSTIARSAIGVGTILGFTVGAPVVCPTLLTLAGIALIREGIHKKNSSTVKGGAAVIAASPVLVPLSIVFSPILGPAIAYAATKVTGPEGDISAEQPRPSDATEEERNN